jgi:protein-tyrosine phosphatase
VSALQIVMVCRGNICRSPTAQAVLQQLIKQAGLQDRIHVDSAGTHPWHSGDPPDARAMRHAKARGYDLTTLRAKGVQEHHYARADRLIAMDQDNLDWLNQRCPPEFKYKLSRLMGYAQTALPHADVPDPYYGGPNGFERVLDLIEAACAGLLEYLKAQTSPAPETGG